MVVSTRDVIALVNAVVGVDYCEGCSFVAVKLRGCRMLQRCSNAYALNFSDRVTANAYRDVHETSFIVHNTTLFVHQASGKKIHFFYFVKRAGRLA